MDTLVNHCQKSVAADENIEFKLYNAQCGIMGNQDY